MERVTGIGGAFFRAADPVGLNRWYRENLGIGLSDDGTPWWQAEGPTVVEGFPADTDYFGRADQAWMLDFRVSNLDAMLEQLRAAGATVDDKIEEMAGIGRFGWAVDPEGNRFELWEPAPEATTPPVTPG